MGVRYVPLTIGWVELQRLDRPMGASMLPFDGGLYGPLEGSMEGTMEGGFYGGMEGGRYIVIGL